MNRLALALLVILAGFQDAYPKLAPYAALRWEGETPEVEIEGAWHVLEKFGDTPAADVVAFCKKTWGTLWQKRFKEDLVEALTKMGKPPGEKIDLTIRAKDKSRVLKDVPMTRENREALRKGRRFLTRELAKEDLEQLRGLLKERYSYADLKGFSWNPALDEIAGALADPPSRGALALDLKRFLAKFGDGHTDVEGDPIPPGYTEFLIGDAGGRLVALKADRSGFYGEGCPYLVSMDGRPVEEWLKAASTLVTAGSPAFVRHQSVRMLRHVRHLRTLMKLPPGDTVELELRPESGADFMTKKSLIFEDRKPVYGSWPVADHRELPGRIGYLRIAEMTGDPKEIAAIKAALEKFKDTKGLVIDVRGNGGGSRDVLRELFPYFMKPTDPLHIVNIAALRGKPAGDEGLLDDRYLYTLASKSWSDPERAALSKFAATFKPGWTPPADRFSAWHYFALKPAETPFRYERPVIVLMDTACFSATDIFLSAFKGWRNVTLMGTQSAGGSGRPLDYTLKNSGIVVSLSSIASFRRDGSLYDGKGIMPDVEVAPKATDFLRGRPDSVLEAAVQRLSK